MTNVLIADIHIDEIAKLVLIVIKMLAKLGVLGRKLPQSIARRAFVDLDGVFQPAPAPRYSETVTDRPEPPRQEGEDAESILLELGYRREQIIDLRESGALL